MEKKFLTMTLLIMTPLVLAACAAIGMQTKGKPVALAEAVPQVTRTLDFEPFTPPLPDHTWLKVSENRVVFLHYDRPVTQRGAKLLFIGDGIKGRFCAEDQPDGGKTGFVHFHSSQKPAGAEHGHGGHEGGEGFWLRHIALGEFEMMGMKFAPGIANMMPTPPLTCTE